MRQRFNKAQFVERVNAGALTSTTLEDRHPSLPGANEPFCTRSQMISYRDPDGNELARAHQYLRPDGTIGASGRPDPKRLYEKGILYGLIKKSNKESAASVQNPTTGEGEPPQGDKTAKDDI